MISLPSSVDFCERACTRERTTQSAAPTHERTRTSSCSRWPDARTPGWDYVVEVNADRRSIDRALLLWVVVRESWHRSGFLAWLCSFVQCVWWLKGGWGPRISCGNSSHQLSRLQRGEKRPRDGRSCRFHPQVRNLTQCTCFPSDERHLPLVQQWIPFIGLSLTHLATC
jgi:hypothetical protein